MQIPGSVVEVSTEIDRLIKKQGRLRGAVREIGLKQQVLARQGETASEGYIHDAQGIYDAMTSGDLEPEKAEQQVVDLSEQLKVLLLAIESEQGDLTRRQEALGRNAAALDGEIEAALKSGAPETMEQLVVSTLEAARDLERGISQAEQASTALQNNWQGIQYLDQWLSQGEQVAPRQLGANGSFGSGPRNTLQLARERVQEVISEAERVRLELAGEGEGLEQEVLAPGWVRTAAGTLGYAGDDD
jgi:exonuclease VII small subunit